LLSGGQAWGGRGEEEERRRHTGGFYLIQFPKGGFLTLGFNLGLVQLQKILQNNTVARFVVI
jgi:hypothetical protein